MSQPMTTADRIRQAKNTPEGMLALAEALDTILERLPAAGTAPTGADEWGAWDDQAAHRSAHAELAQQVRGQSARRRQPKGQEAPEFAKITIPVDVAEVARLQLAYDNANAEFEAARKGGADKPTLIDMQNRNEGIRGRLDLAKNPGEILPVSGDQVGDPASLLIVSVEGDPAIGDVTINLPPANDEQKAMREDLWEQAGIIDWFEPVFRSTPEAIESLHNAFIKGGPMWLYGNRDLVMALPRWARQRLVEDVAMYGDVRMAHEFARDVLKQGAGSDDEEDELALDRFKQATFSHSDSGAPTPFRGNGEG